MPFSDEQLRIKAEASASALVSLTAKQREQTPTSTIVGDYNKLRSLVIEAKPELEQLLPPTIEMIEASYSMPVPNARYQDLHAFFSQIAGLLRGGNVTLGPRRV